MATVKSEPLCDPAAEPLPVATPARPQRRRRSFLSHFRPGWVPASAARYSYTYGLGGAAVFLVLALVVSGIPLLFRYQPGAGAYESVSALTYILPYGRFFRAVHFWAGQMLVVVAVLHLLRVALTGAYRQPRSVNWLIGLGLLAIVVVLDYSGYLLRGDLEAVAAATVGQRILQSVPLVGRALGALVFGPGGEGALLQLSAWHSFALAGAVIALVGWHLWRVRRDGGISRPSDDDGRHISLSQLAAREWVGGLALANLLMLLAMLLPPGLGLPPGQPPPDHVHAPWVFGAVQVLLRSLSPFTAGILAPALAVGLLAAAPFLAQHRPRIARVAVASVLTGAAILTLYFWWRG